MLGKSSGAGNTCAALRRWKELSRLVCNFQNLKVTSCPNRQPHPRFSAFSLHPSLILPPTFNNHLFEADTVRILTEPFTFFCTQYQLSALPYAHLRMSGPMPQHRARLYQGQLIYIHTLCSMTRSVFANISQAHTHRTLPQMVTLLELSNRHALGPTSPEGGPTQEGIPRGRQST